MLGALALGGCANRLPTMAPDVNDVAAAGKDRPTSYPAPPPPASVRILSGPRTLPTARRTVIAPRGESARVRTAVSVPAVPATPRRAAARPSPCTEAVLFAPRQDCVLDPCDPCAGGRCAVPSSPSLPHREQRMSRRRYETRCLVGILLPVLLALSAATAGAEPVAFEAPPTDTATQALPTALREGPTTGSRRWYRRSTGCTASA